MKLILQVLIFLSLSGYAHAQKSILIMLPDDFMWPEYQVPRELYESAGFKVSVAGKSKEELRPDRRNKLEYPESKAVIPDLTFDEVVSGQYDAISFVGGNGAWHDFFPNSKVHEVLKAFLSKNKVTGLLCASTGLLGIAGNFDGSGQPWAFGKKAVGYYKVEGLLKKLGGVKFVDGKVDDETVIKDDNLITGRNPQSSKLFGETMVKAVKEI